MLKLVSLIVSLVLVGPSLALAADGPELKTFRLYEDAGPTGAYIRVDNPAVLKGDAIFHVPKDLEPYHLKGDDALPAMPTYQPTYVPPVPATLHAVSANEKKYVGNHGDYKLKITKATYDAKTSTIHVFYTTEKSFTETIAELNVEIKVSFNMVKR